MVNSPLRSPREFYFHGESRAKGSYEVFQMKLCLLDAWTPSYCPASRGTDSLCDIFYKLIFWGEMEAEGSQDTLSKLR